MSRFFTTNQVTGLYFDLAPEADEATTLEEAVSVYARLLDANAEFALCRDPHACYLSAFGIAPPTGAEMGAARAAVIEHINDPAPSHGLVDK